MSFTFPSLRRLFAAGLILTMAGAFTAASVGDASARLGGGSSFGNRGSRTFSVPSATPTAPRSSAIPGSGYGYGQNRGYAPAAGGGFFSGGFGRGLLGGLVGAGLFGMLFGNGFGGGLGGASSILGLLIQLALLYLAFRFIMGFFRQGQPAFGGLFGGAGFGRSPAPGVGGGMGYGGAPRGEPISIQADDYTWFERRLGEAQTLYSAENLGGLRQITTPQMADHFAGELAENARQGVANRLSDIRLLQGDLSEAWREGSTDYATVAMRFALNDTMVERTTGRLVSGYNNGPQEVTELWTFVRPAGSGPDRWVLSAVQQAG
jgi:predicted lipid-binding transport protein (Tim44 family)